MTTYSPDRVDPSSAVGRQKELDWLAESIRQAHSFTLSAGRRFGKTTLARTFETNCQTKPEVGLLYVDKHGVLPDQTPDALVRRVCRDIRRAAGRDASVPDTINFEQIESECQDALESLAVIGLVFDEVEAIAGTPWGQSFLDYLRHLVSNSSVAGAVCVGLLGGPQLDHVLESAGSPIANVCWPADLTPLDRDAVARLAHLGCPEKLRTAVTKEVWDKAGGHPYLAQLVLQALEANRWERAAVSDGDEFMVVADRRLAKIIGDYSPSFVDDILTLPRPTMEFDDSARRQMLASGLVRADGASLIVNGQIVQTALTHAGPKTASRHSPMVTKAATPF